MRLDANRLQGELIDNSKYATREHTSGSMSTKKKLHAHDKKVSWKDETFEQRNNDPTQP